MRRNGRQRLTTHAANLRRNAPEAARAVSLAPKSAPPGKRVDSADIAVFVSGHTHSPSSSNLVRPDGATTAIVNTGCWLHQLQPVQARLGAPHVFVPVFVQTHARVRRSDEGITVVAPAQACPDVTAMDRAPGRRGTVTQGSRRDHDAARRRPGVDHRSKGRVSLTAARVPRFAVGVRAGGPPHGRS